MTTTRKLVALLSPDQRRGAISLMALMLIGMVLEALGIGLVVPALMLMTQRDLADRYPVVAPWLVRLGNPSHEWLVIGGMLSLVAIAAIKALFLAFSTWWQARFAFGLGTDLSQRLFGGYLRQPYAFHLQRNSAQLIRTTVAQADEIRGIVQSVLLLVTEILVVLGILVLLVFVEPVGTLIVVMTLSGAAWAFQRATRARTVHWGAARQMHEEKRLQYLQEGLGGAKDVILLGRSSDFLRQYQFHNVGNATMGQRQATLQALPRLWLELLAVAGLATLVLVMIARGRPVDLLLPTIGVFAAAAFRLMPSVIRIINTIQSVHFSLPVINTVHSELQLLAATPPLHRGAPLPLKAALVLEQVSFRYETAETPALQNVSLTIPRGSSVGFIGATGAGKSTLVDIILGLFTPDSGAVKVDGIKIQTCLRGWQDQIGYVPQTVFLTDDTLRRNVAFGLPEAQVDDAAVWRAIRAAQLERLVNSLPKGLDTIVGERGTRLSGGERQRIGIARALYHDPPVLVLDEATSSLDTATEEDVMSAVRALHGEKTILIIAHRLSTVAHCDRLFRLTSGCVAEASGPPVALAASRASRVEP